jgi:RNA polymerase sigma-70 factor (ECF subfamily)
MSVSHLRLVSSRPSQMAGDAACLGAFQQELDYVFRTLRRLGIGPGEIEDLAQEVFLALRHSWAQYDTERPLRPYLFGIAFRIASAHQRKRKREVMLGVVEVDDMGPGPDDTLAAKQARAVVMAALEKVPLPRRAVLVMHDIDGVSMADVAAALSIPRFTAYSRLRKARRELEVALKRMLKEPERR